MADRVPPAAVQPLGNGRFLLRRGDDSTLAYAVVDGARVWVWLDGFQYAVGGAVDGGRAAGSADELGLAAPMPATVRSITVQPGQEVSAGDVLIVLEAMKMELPVKAPRAGTVRALRCREGELVQPGVLLVDLS